MHFFTSSFGDGVVLEVRKGFGNEGYSSVKVKLSKMAKKDLPQVLSMLDQIAQKVEEK